MACIFVAYGDPDCRQAVLEFALERADAAGDDLVVHHIRQAEELPDETIRSEIDATVQRVAPSVAYDVQIDGRGGQSDAANVSTRKRLLDAVLEDERDFVYVVMGNIERSLIEELSLTSNTKAVLGTHQVPVLLVPA